MEATDAAVRSKYDDTLDADSTLPPVWSPNTLGARSSIRVAGDVTPTIVSVSVPETSDGTYGVGEEIDLEVLFTTRVFVRDSITLPYLLVEIGDERRGEAKVRRRGWLFFFKFVYRMYTRVFGGNQRDQGGEVWKLFGFL